MEIVGEEYTPMGHTDYTTILSKIKEADPDFIFNTLNGDSNVAFFKQFKDAGLTPEQIQTCSVSDVYKRQKVTRQFLISKKLFAEKDIELLGAAFTNDTSIAVIYKDGKDGAIVVTVDVASGKVDCFDRQSRGRAMRWIAPLDAGAGKG